MIPRSGWLVPIIRPTQVTPSHWIEGYGDEVTEQTSLPGTVPAGKTDAIKPSYYAAGQQKRSGANEATVSASCISAEPDPQKRTARG